MKKYIFKFQIVGVLDDKFTDKTIYTYIGTHEELISIYGTPRVISQKLAKEWDERSKDYI